MPQRLIDLTGRQFGHFTVLSRVSPEIGKKPQWICRCDCPPKILRIVYGYSLIRGDSTSCGCAQREGMSKRRMTHGQRRLADPGVFGDDRRQQDPAYGSWSAMKSRCRDHPRYAGRGITVCPRWNGLDGFTNFLADMGPRPLGTTLNRIDNDGNYCAATCGGLCGHTVSNCNWATHTEQMLGRGHIRQFTVEETKDIIDSVARGQSQEWLARKYNVGRRVVRRVLRDAQRIKAGVDPVHATDSAALRKLVAGFHRDGFPWGAYDGEDDPIGAVQASNVNVNGDAIVSTGRVGQVTCLLAQRHRFEARHVGQPSLAEAFADVGLLSRALQYRLARGYSIDPSAVLRTLQALVRAPQNFPPALARWLVDEYAPRDGVVLDPCAGFGGRLLGTVASTKNLRYVGFDLEPRTVDGNNVLAKRLGVSGRAAVTLRDAVSSESWPRADLVLTSPPYFNLEDYGEASRCPYASYDAWRDGFVHQLVEHALAAAPVVILNVAPVGKNDLPADVVAATRTVGGTVERVIAWPLPKFGQRQREEKILVIRAGTRESAT